MGSEGQSVAGELVRDCAPHELERVLEAWHVATERLRQTHETLRQQVARLSDELETKNRELARKNRLADLGRMAAHVAHEVRNGLAPITLYLSMLRRRLVHDTAALGTLEKVEAGFTALEATVHDLLNFTSERQPVWRLFAIGQMLRDACEGLAPQLDAQHIRLTIDADPRLRVLADSDLLRRAVLNLVLNALDAMPQGGELVITALETSRGCELEVADSGPGIDDQHSERIFEPFYTTKSDGTGLGLAIVFQIVQAHGGHIEAHNCPEGGAAFTIVIPRHVWEAAA
jgi:signal transduction histidine kinase